MRIKTTSLILGLLILLCAWGSLQAAWVKSPAIRAGGFTQVQSPAVMQELEKRGLTDAFYEVKGGSYPAMKANVQAFLNSLPGTKIKLHIILPPFRNWDGSFADPADQAYRNNFLGTVKRIFRDCPQLSGLSLNDYLYPDQFWKTATQEQRNQNRRTLVDFARQVRNAVHSAKLSALFSINIYPVPSHDAYCRDLAMVCDYIMPEVYRLSPNVTHEWFESALVQNLKWAGRTPMICGVITSNHLDSGYTTSEIVKDVQIALKHKVAGYMLWQWGYCPSDLYWPK